MEIQVENWQHCLLSQPLTYCHSCRTFLTQFTVDSQKTIVRNENRRTCPAFIIKSKKSNNLINSRRRKNECIAPKPSSIYFTGEFRAPNGECVYRVGRKDEFPSNKLKYREEITTKCHIEFIKLLRAFRIRNFRLGICEMAAFRRLERISGVAFSPPPEPLWL